MVKNEVGHPRIHDLDRICKICVNFEQSFSEIAKHCCELTKYASAPKYPHGIDVTENDAKIALRYAQTIYKKVESCFG